MIAYTVQPGDTLSGIAAAHGESLAAIEHANPQFSAALTAVRLALLPDPLGQRGESMSPPEASACPLTVIGSPNFVAPPLWESRVTVAVSVSARQLSSW